MPSEEAHEAELISGLSTDELRRQLAEARAHQRAAVEVLRVIAEYRNATQPVFDVIAKSAAELCGAAYCAISDFDGTHLQLRATHNFNPEVLAIISAEYPCLPDRRKLNGRAILERKTFYSSDLFEDSNYPQQHARSGKWRSLISVPMMQRGEPVGTISVGHPNANAFSEQQIGLVEMFAEQAVIAIDNANLFNRLEEKTGELRELNQTLEERVAVQVAELDRAGRLRRFLPRQLAELVLTSGDESILDSHRREVSVAFCDLRGFTAFSEVAEPEEVTSVLGEYHDVAGPLIEKHGGTLERFLGDGLMVLFNDPIPCDDPAQRAVRLAVELRDAMNELSEQWSSEGYELGFGVGIAHGFATIGRIGFEGRSDYTAIGSVVNQAARLCDEAGAGEIIITQRIANIAKQLIEAEPLGALDLKGLRQPVRALRLVGIVT